MIVKPQQPPEQPQELAGDPSDLEVLYRETAPVGDVSHFDHTSAPWWRRLAIAAVVLVVIGSLGAWFGLMMLSRYNTANSSDEVTLTIEAPTSAAVAASTSYRLVVNNQSSVALEDARVRVNYPAGFIWESATREPEGATKNSWTLPEIPAGQSADITVSGMLLGEVGSLQPIFGVVTYRPANFQSDLQASSSTSTKLAEGAISVLWREVSETKDGEITYEVVYENKGERAISNAQLSILPSPHFTITSLEPAAAQPDAWRVAIPELKVAEQGVVKVRGRWTSEASGEEVLTARLELSQGESVHLITSGEHRVLRAGRELVLKLSMNEAETPSAVNIGDTVSYALAYENTSSETLSDVTLRVLFSSSVIDWNKVTVADGGTVDKSNIVWESGTAPLITRIAPNSKGVLRWRMTLLEAPPASGDLAIVATPLATFHYLGDPDRKRSVEGTALTIAVNAPVSVTLAARYFDDEGQPIGSGPLPPVVGEETTYQLVLRVKGVVHSLRDVVVTTALPANVEATGNPAATAGGIKVNGATIEWRIPELRAGSEPEATSFITLTPRGSDLGRVVVLSGKTTLTAEDQVTRGQVEVTGGVATTNLDTDPVGRGKGVVTR